MLHWSLAGAAIGVICLLMLFLYNRRLGVSTGFESACATLVKAPYFRREELASSHRWRLSLLFGLLCGGLLSSWISGGFRPPWGLGAWFEAEVSGHMAVKAAWMFAGGVLVGLGTRIAGGCTSGHGIFGVANFERSSLIATLAFMAAGVATTQLLVRVVFA